MALIAKSTLDELILAQTRSLVALERAEVDTLVELREHLKATLYAESPKMRAVHSEIRRRVGQSE